VELLVWRGDEMSAMEGDSFYKCRITPELVDALATRDASGNLVTYSVGDEDADGFVDLIFQVHYDDNLVQSMSAELAAMNRLLVAAWRSLDEAGFRVPPYEEWEADLRARAEEGGGE
jgi:hypothetical protein